MKRPIRNALRTLVMKTLPDSSKLRHLAYMPKLETWCVNHSGKHPVFDDRYKMYDFLNSEIILDNPIDYLEFGVWKGASIKYWTDINKDSRSIFYGFDTFTGLPEEWDGLLDTAKKNAFNANGQNPQFEDSRVSYVEGLFQDTLPSFMDGFQPKNQLVIHNDSDLYSATLYVLTCANKIIVPGTIVIFDEFSSVLHEFRALEDYCSSYIRNYEVVAATKNNGQVAIKLL